MLVVQLAALVVLVAVVLVVDPRLERLAQPTQAAVVVAAVSVKMARLAGADTSVSGSKSPP